MCYLIRMTLLLTVVAVGARGAEALINDDVVTYIKAVKNPHDFGLRGGRYYPYSTPQGRRIGYGQPIIDKAWYRQGCTPAAAEQQLRAGLQAAEAQLRAMWAQKYPDHPFDRLAPESKQILLDFAFDLGAERLSDEFCRAVLAEDWSRLVKGFLYIRIHDGWPDTLANHAFAERWIKSGALKLDLKGKKP